MGSEKKSVYIDSNMPLLASILEKKTCLYALNEGEEEFGQYKGMILSINGKNRVVDWESIAMLSDLPQLEYMDLNGDKKEELVVILRHADGTGSVIQEIHVINPRNFDEYEKEDPIDVIESRVEITKLSSQEAEIKIGKKKTHVNL